MGIPLSLNSSIKEDVPKLYWPSPPYEGQLKLRFCCAACNNEAILLEPFPVYWKDCVGLKGHCFTCNGVKKINTLFLEGAKEREPLYIFKGDQANRFADNLKKFLRSGPPSQPSPDAVHFKRVCHPPNIRNRVLPATFMWPEGAVNFDLKKKRTLFLKETKNTLRHEASWTLQIPSRSEMLHYTFKQFLFASPEQLRSELTIKFVGEPAVDLGGVTREFFSEISKKMLDPSIGLFVPTGPNGTFHPSPASSVNENHLGYFRFFGRFVGKALFEGELVSANFTRAMFKLMLGQHVTFEDFQTVDKDLYKHLREILEYDETGLEALYLDFTATVDHFGIKQTCDLVPGGKDQSVNKQNIHEYVKLYASWRMIDSIQLQLMSFLEGFYDVIPVQLLSIFNPSELEMLVCGVAEFNVEQWRKHAVMYNFPQNSPAIGWFWEILSEFDNQQRSMVFHFATGTGRLVQFSFLFPPFNVYCLGPQRAHLLPFGHTCFNRLDLPLYPSKEIMKQKLLTTITFGAVGFALE